MNVGMKIAELLGDGNIGWYFVLPLIVFGGGLAVLGGCWFWAGNNGKNKVAVTTIGAVSYMIFLLVAGDIIMAI